MQRSTTGPRDLRVYILNGGVDQISRFAHGPDRGSRPAGGLGGYTNVSQVLSAIRSDNAGGSVLPLDQGHYIHFVGAPPGSLHAANFRVG